MNNASKIYLDQVAIGRRIRKIRKVKGVSIEAICRQMDNISPQAVYKWQRGACLPDIENLLNLSIMLETPIEDILLGSDENEEMSSFLPIFQWLLLYQSYEKVSLTWIAKRCGRKRSFINGTVFLR